MNREPEDGPFLTRRDDNTAPGSRKVLRPSVETVMPEVDQFSGSGADSGIRARARKLCQSQYSDADDTCSRPS